MLAATARSGELTAAVIAAATAGGQQLTDRDIVVGGIASGKDPKTTPVSEVMNHDFTCCHEDDDIAQAAIRGWAVTSTP